MSIKIFTGFRLANTTLDEAFARANAFRPKFEAMKAQAEAELLARKTCRILDKRAAFDLYPEGTKEPEPCPQPLSHVHTAIWDRVHTIRREQRRDPEVDFEFELTFIPVGGHILGVIQTERPEWRDAWRAEPGVEDFAYWNNTNPPEDLSAEEWHERERLWEAAMALHPSKNFGRAGVIVQFAETEIPIVHAPEVLAAVPPFEARVRGMARDIVSARLSAEAWKARGEDVSPGQAMEIFWEVDKVLRSSEGQSQIAAMEAEVRTRLKDPLTVEDLLGWSPEAVEEPAL